MFVSLHRRPEGGLTHDAVDQLLACHARIRSFTALARRLGDALEGPAPEVADAASRVHRYFTVALPLHAQDEDLSLTPKLLAAGPPREVVAALEEMSRQHLELEETLSGLIPCWALLAEDPSLLSNLRGALTEGAGRLARRFEAHLGMEEAVIFPTLRAYVPAEALDALAGEIKARRGVSGAAWREPGAPSGARPVSPRRLG